MYKKIKILGLATMLLLFARTAWAYDFESGGIYYKIISDTAPYMVEVTYETSNYNSYSGNITIPATVTYNNKNYSVTAIGANAFGGCSGLTSITIPNSVTSIEDGAFSGCNSLTKTNYTGTIEQWCRINFGFYNANPIRYSLNFYVNNQLVTNLVIPNTITTISSNFAADTCLVSISIPNSVTSIGHAAFADCSGLTSITIPNSVTTIGGYAFAGCTGLTSISIPNSVTTIGGYAFYECIGLTSITIPNSVTSIEICAFNGCSGLTSITIPNSVTSIEDGAFFGCSGLTAICVENGNTEYDSRNNCNAIIETATNTLMLGCKNTIIPNSVTSILYSAFTGCTSLTSITIPNSVTTIGACAFWGCSGLTSITIPNSVTSIEDGAFSGCSGLNSITFCRPNTTIAGSAFDRAAANIPIYIPCGSLAWYSNQLSDFTNLNEIPYIYSVTTQDSIMGEVATITAPTCSNARWIILAAATDGYYFSHWSDGSTQNPRTLTLTQDTTLLAYFNAINIQSADTAQGLVQMGSKPKPNREVTVLAIPKPGYAFAYWEDRINGQTMTHKDGNNTENPRTVVLEDGMTLIAHFTKSTTGIQDGTAENNAVRIYPNPAKNQITISGLKQQTDIQIVNAMGQTIKRFNNINESIVINIQDLSKGMYFVRIGNNVRKLIVE